MKNIVIVHGAWADGSGWQEVHRLLKARGYNVSLVQNPLTSLADDVAATSRVLARQDGPALLVGHSYGGVVITEAGGTDKVAGLVYVAAFAPDAGESVLGLIEGAPPPPVQSSQDQFLFFDTALFPSVFAAGLDPELGAFMADAQVPVAVAAFAAPVTRPAWRVKSSWYVVAAEDQVIPPQAQRQFAARAGATVTELRVGHAAYVVQPEAVAAVIDQAAQAVK